MKLIKIFGLALVASLATMAFAGAGTASAKNVALCKEKVEICPEAQRYGVGTEIKAESQVQGKLKASETEISCQESLIEGKIKAVQGNQQVKGEITTATWSLCKRVNPDQTTIEACTVTAVQLPWQAHVEQNVAQDQNGKMWIGPREVGTGQPGVSVDCPGLLHDGTFKANETQPIDQEQEYAKEWIQMQITGGGGAGEELPKATANQQELKGPFGVQGFWDAQYKLVKPATPLYVTQQ